MKTGTIARLSFILLNSFAVCFAFPHATKAQMDEQRSSNYTVDSNSVINIKGTSPLHDWGMTAHSFTGNAKFSFTENKNDGSSELSAVSGFSLTLPVLNLKSENKGMEKNAYKALKEDQYKDIVFELTSAKFKPSGNRYYLILLHGNLTMAGITQPTTLKTSARVNEDGTIFCTGSLPIYLSDYKIERPSYLLGTMKVGDVLVLNYNLLLVK
jgi:polyisoprenoid-binding protein YceI